MEKGKYMILKKGLIQIGLNAREVNHLNFKMLLLILWLLC